METGPSRTMALRQALGLANFGIAFGFVEAAVVVYLRALLDPLRERFYPLADSSEVFPVLTLRQLELAGLPYVRLLVTEVLREAATLVLLGGVGLVLARNARSWLAAFVVGFGWWDLAYYLFLKLLLDWPASLFSWDILFLVPVPWSAPVLAPVLVATAMVSCGQVALWMELAGKPLRLGAGRLIGLLLAAAMLLVSFLQNSQLVAAGGIPEFYPWGWFTAGLTLGILTFLHALLRNR